MLPLVFLSLAALTLLWVLFAVWQSVRAVTVGTSIDDGSVVDARRASLLDEKIALLRSIKDLEFEHGVGKITDADFQELDAKYRARAKSVLKELDTDLGVYRERAYAMIDERLKAAPATTAKANTTDVPSVLTCAGCGTSNDNDSVFCKKCGARVQSEESAS